MVQVTVPKGMNCEPIRHEVLPPFRGLSCDEKSWLGYAVPRSTEPTLTLPESLSTHFIVFSHMGNSKGTSGTRNSSHLFRLSDPSSEC